MWVRTLALILFTCGACSDDSLVGADRGRLLPSASAHHGHTATLLVDGRILVVGGDSTAESFDPRMESWRTEGVVQRTLHTSTVLPNGEVLIAGGASSEGRLAPTQIYDGQAFSSGPSLSQARQNHTATRLDDGRVILVGGDDTSILSSVEVFDGTTISPANPLLVARTSHSSVLLSDRRVLTCGGLATSGPLDSCEVFDGTWSVVASMHSPRSHFTATLLHDGRVFVAGGRSQDALSSAELFDPATNTWTLVASMSSPRSRHAAVLLPSNRVAVIGGSSGLSAVGSIELYDPATDTWTSSPMSEPRISPAAVLLPGSRILIFGGENTAPLSSLESASFVEAAAVFLPRGPKTRSGQSMTALLDGTVLAAGGGEYRRETASAQIYDPATMQWIDIPDMPNARADHAAVRLLDGRVLLAGGTDGRVLGTGLIYDPATRLFRSIPNLARARNLAQGILLDDGRALIVGGYDNGAIGTTEIFDPVTGTWTSAGNLTLARSNFKLARLPDGRILAAGGISSGNTASTSCEIFNPATNQWTVSASMSGPRSSHSMTVLQDGRILVTGGHSGDIFSTRLQTAEIFDPQTETWAPTGSLRSARTLHLSELLPDGQVLIAGGLGASGTSEIFNPETGTFSFGAELSSDRSDPVWTTLPDGRVLVGGGFVDSAEIYDIALGWINAGTMIAARSSGASAILPGGRTLLVGGVSAPNRPVRHPEIYDANLDQWRKLPIVESRWNLTATALLDGRVLLFGGISSGYLGSTVLFDGATESSRSVQSGFPRASHRATLLEDGRVLVTGGKSFGGILTDTQIFNPATESWSNGGQLNVRRWMHSSTRLADGRVLVSGGLTDSTRLTKSVEIFDPASGSWATATPMSTERANHAGVLLRDGRLLIIGGDDGANALASCEIYEPERNSWKQAATLHEGRGQTVATLLDDGRVLVTGGISISDSGFLNRTDLASAEIYDPVLDSWTLAGRLTTARSGHFVIPARKGLLIAGGEGAGLELASPELFQRAGSGPTFGPSVIASPGETILLTGLGFTRVSESTTGSAQNHPVLSVLGPTRHTPSVDVPKAVPNNATVVSTVSVGDSGTIGGLSVSMVLNHSYMGDLRISLRHPDGTSILLADRRGGSGDDFLGSFRDGGELLSQGAPPFDGTFQPEESLSGLDGKPAQGVWQLVIEDAASPSTGTLDSWSLGIVWQAPHPRVTSFSDSAVTAVLPCGTELGSSVLVTVAGVSSIAPMVVARGQCLCGAGTSCDDGNTCTRDDSCDGAGNCVGTSYSCTPLDCHASVTCDGAGGCLWAPKPDSTSCQDDGNQCTRDICSLGVCEHPRPIGNPVCDDGQGCTINDLCISGSCLGTLKSCNTPEGPSCLPGGFSRVYDPIGTCDFADGLCHYSSNTIVCAEACHDGLCTGDPCAGVTCVTPPGQCYESTGTCHLGACIYTPRTSGSACDDQNQCTGSDHCESGTCRGYSVGQGTACDDGDDCTVNDACSASVCRGTSYRCPQPGVCEERVDCDGRGGCTVVEAPVGTACADEDDCTAGTSCDGHGLCGSSYACRPGPCDESASCDGTGGCVFSRKASGEVCDDGDFCTRDDVCNENGVCQGVTGECAPPTECQTRVQCDGFGGCTYDNKPKGASCSPDSVACTFDVCDGNGLCVHEVAPRTCLISGQCHEEGDRGADCQVCNPVASTTEWSLLEAGAACRGSGACQKGICTSHGSCVEEPVPDGVACDTDAVCGGICEAGACIGEPADCEDHDPCTLDLCEPNGCRHVNACLDGGVVDAARSTDEVETGCSCSLGRSHRSLTGVWILVGLLNIRRLRRYRASR